MPSLIVEYTGSLAHSRLVLYHEEVPFIEHAMSMLLDWQSPIARCIFIAASAQEYGELRCEFGAG